MISLPPQSLSTSTVRDNPGIPVQLLDLEKVDKNGRTSLMRAVLANKLQKMSLLLSRGACVSTKDKDGFDPLILASIMGHTRAIKILLFYHAKYQKDNRGRNALIKSIQYDEFEATRLLLNQDIDPNDCDNNGKSALHYAVKKNSVITIEALFAHKANINIRNNKGDTPLMDALRRSHDICVHLLLYRKPDLSCENKLGITTLETAIYYGRESMVRLLISCGDDPERVDSSFKTPWVYAYHYRTKNRDQILPLLETSKRMKFYNLSFGLIKITAHSLHLAGSTMLDSYRPINWEWNAREFALKKFADTLFYFAQQTLLISPSFAYQIKNDLLFAANHRDHTYEHVVDRIQRDEKVIISTGYQQHATLALFWKDLLVIFDSSPYHNPRAQFFHFDKSRITANHIKEFHQLKQRDVNYYTDTIHKTLSTALTFQKNKRELALEKQLSYESQIVGNCTWKSIEGIIYIYLNLEQLRSDLFLSDNSLLESKLNYTTANIQVLMSNLSLFQQHYFLEKCATYSIDNELIKRGLEVMKKTTSQSKHPLDRNIVSLVEQLEDRVISNNQL